MAYPSVSKTFVDAALASADDVNQNFTDIINGISDGTKDLNVANITASTVSFSGGLSVPSLGVTNTLTVNGVIYGTRHVISWWNAVDGNNSGYLYGTQGANPYSQVMQGFTMPNSGSVLAMTYGIYVEACANAQTMTPKLMKNVASFIAASTLTVSAAVTGAKSGVVSTYTRGSHVFATGDTLSAYVVSSGTAGSAAAKTFLSVTAEVVFDT